MAASNSPYVFGHSLSGDPELPAILLLHGFLGNKDDWAEIVPQLNGKFCGLTVDLPGHGDTIVSDDSLYRMENCAAGLVELIDKLGLDRCHLVAYSMGGRLALYLAVNFPERFSSIVIESSSPGLKTEAERLARVEQDKRLAAKLTIGDFRQFLTDWYDQPMFESLRKHRNRFLKLIESRMNNNPALLAKSLSNMGTGAQPSLWDRLDRIGTPVLLVTGEQDPRFTAIADEMSGLCRGTEKCIIADSGHNVHFEQPQEYIKHVNQFLQKNK